MAEQNNQDRAAFYKKLLAAQKLVEGVKKSGRNEMQKYNYAQAADVAREASKCFNEAGLAFSSTTISFQTQERVTKDKNSGQEKSVFYAIAKMKYTLTDINTGYSQSATYEGEGMDYGDKARPKAYTNSLKYFLIQTLLIPTGDDPEASDVDAGQGNGSRSQNGSGDRKATENQIKYLSTLVTKKGVPEDNLRVILADNANGKTSRLDLTSAEASKVIDHLQSLPDKPAS